MKKILNIIIFILSALCSIGFVVVANNMLIKTPITKIDMFTIVILSFLGVYLLILYFVESEIDEK